MRTTGRIVIVGGGFAGAFAARYLRRRLGREARIELIDRKNYFVFQPLLPEVAAAGVSVLDAVTPLRLMLKDVQIRTAMVQEVDFANRVVHASQGEVGNLVSVPYDHLVLAFGQEVDLSRYPGLADHGLTMKTAADAFALRNHVIGCLEQADVCEDPERKRRLLTFVVVGAGLSGIETVGDLQHLVARSRRYYPNIEAGEVRFVVVEFQKRILPEVDAGLAEYASHRLAARGIEIRLGTPVRSAAEGSITVGDGEAILADTVVATIGNGPSPLLQRLSLPSERGRIVTTRTLAVEGLTNVWAIGDAARIPLEAGEAPKLAPPTAQAAVQEARHLAGNIAAVLAGESPAPFAYRSRGTLASLGNRQAVADVYGYRFHGVTAWLLWRMFYLLMLPTFGTKLRVAIDRILDLMMPRNIVQTQSPGTSAIRIVHHRPGDKAVSPGSYGAGVHLVLHGSYECMVRGETEPRRVYGPGERFGEEAILEHRPSDALIRAREDASCLLIRRADFERIAEALASAGNRSIEGAETFSRSLAAGASEETGRAP